MIFGGEGGGGQSRKQLCHQGGFWRRLGRICRALQQLKEQKHGGNAKPISSASC